MNPEESKTQAPEGGQPPRSSKSHPVKVYLTVLFVVSLLLLTMSFFMQQRSHQALEDLNESMSSNESVVELKLDKQKLEFQIQELQDALTAAEKEQAGWDEERADMENQAKALEWLRQIEQASRSSHSKTAELIQAFEQTGLEEALPDESVVEGGTSPAETYRNLYAMIF